jgi:hypothetical protein
MKKFFTAFLIGIVSIGTITGFISSPSVAMADDIDKILRAKDIVRAMVNYPDTLVFHEFSTKVNGNTVTLKFTCKNGFGVPETHTMDIKVN